MGKRLMIMMVIALMATLLLTGSLAGADSHIPDPQIPESAALTLTPEYEENVVGEVHTVVATYTIQGVPQVGKAILFEIISGPNADGVLHTVLTDEMGQAVFSYVGDGGPCIDTIRAGTAECLKAYAQKKWVEVIAPPPPPPPPVVPGVTTWGLLGAAIMLGLLIPFAIRRGMLASASR